MILLATLYLVVHASALHRTSKHHDYRRVLWYGESCDCHACRPMERVHSYNFSRLMCVVPVSG